VRRLAVGRWSEPISPRGRAERTCSLGGRAAEAAPPALLPVDPQIRTYLAYGSMSGKVAVSDLLGPEVIVSVTSVKVTLTSTGTI
jgi:hypothetical protein